MSISNTIAELKNLSTEIKHRARALRELRKKHAKEYESFVEKSLKANSNKIPEEERNFLLKNIKKWNDKEKLIDRNG